MFANMLELPLAEPVKAGTPARQAVLIIDDDEALSESLARRLGKQGFATYQADSGASGLHLARAKRPNLIVLDLCLPDADGLNICAQLADEAETCTIPVVILSALEKPDLLRLCREAGCYFYLRKPYDPNVLLTLIRQALQETDEPTEDDRFNYGT